MRKESVAAPRPSRSRQALLAAATALLDQRDAAEISITDIVALAGVTRPTFYHAFDDLSAAFTAAAVGRLNDAFAKIDPEMTSRAQMGDAFRTVLRSLAEHEKFYQRVLDGPGGYRLLSAITEAVAHRLHTSSPITALLPREASLGGRSRSGSAIAAGAVWLMIDWLTCPSDDRPPVDVIAEQMRDFVYHSVVGGIAAPARSSQSLITENLE